MTMALGKRRSQQQEMWVATTSLPKSEGHVFYRKLNEILAEAGFDRWVERQCRPYYHDHLGRPSIPPGVYFRMLLVGYFEGIGSQRGIAWLCGIEKVQNRYLIAAVARNLGLVLRKLFGIGTPRGLQVGGGLVFLAWFVWIHISGFLRCRRAVRSVPDALGVTYATAA
jgi:hypothetical protein